MPSVPDAGGRAGRHWVALAAALEPHQGVRRLHRGEVPRPGGSPGLVLRAARPVRVRQDDDPAHGRRAGDADVRHDPPRRHRGDVREAVQATGQHRVPELRAVPAPRHHREHRVRPQAARRLRHRAAGRRDAGAGGAGAAGPQEAGPAVRRPAAARGAGPRADQPARGAAARRAARCPRPQAAPLHAARAQAHPDRGRHHLRARHARPGGGHDDGRHHRGDERRRDRADGCAQRPVREPAHDVRRQLPRPVQPDRGGHPGSRERSGRRCGCRERTPRSRATARTRTPAPAGSASGRRRCSSPRPASPSTRRATSSPAATSRTSASSESAPSTWSRCRGART